MNIVTNVKALMDLGCRKEALTYIRDTQALLEALERQIRHAPEAVE